MAAYDPAPDAFEFDDYSHFSNVRGKQDRPKWLGGKLLLASPRLDDPNFERAVVLLLDHGPKGAVGVVLDRPSVVDVKEILAPWSEQAEITPPATVFRGGPVSPDGVIGLARAIDSTSDQDDLHGIGERLAGVGVDVVGGEDGSPFRWRKVIGDVGTVDLSSPPESQPVKINGVRLFAGYSGWSPGQLEEELEEGSWFPVEALSTDVFFPAPRILWRHALRRQRSKLALLASYPSDPSHN